MPALLRLTTMQSDFDRICSFLLLEEMDKARWSLAAFYRDNSGSLAELQPGLETPVVVAISAALLQFMREWFMYLTTSLDMPLQFDTAMPAWVGSVEGLDRELSLGCPSFLSSRLEPHFLKLGIRANSGELEFV